MSKKNADNLFFANLSVIASICRVPFIADRFALYYYLAVKNGGAGAYNRGKEKDHE